MHSLISAVCSVDRRGFLQADTLQLHRLVLVFAGECLKVHFSHIVTYTLIAKNQIGVCICSLIMAFLSIDSKEWRNSRA